jgi:uncharacterized surface protein with fasciclin (FAS1) repeats
VHLKYFDQCATIVAQNSHNFEPKLSTMIKPSLFFLTLFLLISASGVFAQDNPCGIDGVVVDASNFEYAPDALMIEPGETVVWVNMGGTHDVNGVSSSIGSAWDNPETFSLGSVVGSAEGVCIGAYTFTVEGLYNYDCSIGSHAENGMVATIQVTLPKPPPTTVWDIIVESESHTILEAAVIAAELDVALNGEGPLTVFAPTDAAITTMIELMGMTLESFLAYEFLEETLLNHVVGSQLMSSDFEDNQTIPTLLEGNTLFVTLPSGMLHINDAMVVTPDLTADNGVVHAINAVLLPSIPFSVTETADHMELTLFPNPVSDGTLQLTGDWRLGSQLRILDAQGRLIEQEILRSNQLIWDISTWPVGMYTLSVVSETRQQSQQFIVH